MDSFVYKWTNITLNKIYIGWHKGTEDDGYICSSASDRFWNDFKNINYDWKREILHKGPMKECQLLESELLDSIDITSENVYNNRNNLMFNLNDEVRSKLSKAAKKRALNPEYIKKLSEAKKRLWEDPAHRDRIKKTHTGKKLSDQAKDKIRAARANQKITKESRIKAGEKLKGRPRPESVRLAISRARKNDPMLQCPHCSKFGKGGSMSRWHFDNCKGRVKAN